MISTSLSRPDDWHLHLHNGEVLASVLPDHTAPEEIVRAKASGFAHAGTDLYAEVFEQAGALAGQEVCTMTLDQAAAAGTAFEGVR